MHRLATIPADPAAPMFHRFRSEAGQHLLVVPYSRVFDLSADLARAFDQSGADQATFVDALATPEPGEAPLSDVVMPAPQSISLNVSSSCNLACSYCYAARGSFGGAQDRPMAWDTARAAIDALVERSDPLRRSPSAFSAASRFSIARLCTPVWNTRKRRPHAAAWTYGFQ
jgi:uncharacterized protein